MTDAARGRAHLEALLGRAEKVVRVSPADTLVLMGVKDAYRPEEFAPLIELLQDAGVEFGGMLVLPEGMGLDSIDMEELHRAYVASSEAEEGTEFRVIGQVGIPDVEVSCPRCAQAVPVAVTVLTGDTGSRLAARARADETELALHEMVCAGSATAGV